MSHSPSLPLLPPPQPNTAGLDRSEETSDHGQHDGNIPPKLDPIDDVQLEQLVLMARNSQSTIPSLSSSGKYTHNPAQPDSHPLPSPPASISTLPPLIRRIATATSHESLRDALRRSSSNSNVHASGIVEHHPTPAVLDLKHKSVVRLVAMERSRSSSLPSLAIANHSNHDRFSSDNSDTVNGIQVAGDLATSCLTIATTRTVIQHGDASESSSPTSTSDSQSGSLGAFLEEFVSPTAELAVRRFEAACKIQAWWRPMAINAHFRKIRQKDKASLLSETSASHTSNFPLRQPIMSIADLTAGPQLKVALDSFLPGFNANPAKAVASLCAEHLASLPVEQAGERLAGFFHAQLGQFDKVRMGELLGCPDPLSVALMRSFISSIPFADMDFSDALRHLMAHFRLPGEAQKIDRILEQFAGTYHTLNPGTFKEESTPYILAFSLIMLNTDAHNPAVKKKMSLADFIRNNRGIDGGADLPQKLLRKLYWEVVSREIVMDGDEMGRSARVMKNLVGAERIHAAFISEFAAQKVVRQTLRERRLFLFTNCLVVAKIRPGPRYQVSRIIEHNTFELLVHPIPPESFGLTEKLNAVSFHPIPGATRTAIHAFVEDEMVLSDPELLASDEPISLAFSSEEERDVFVENYARGIAAKAKEMESVERFIETRVAVVKANLELRYLPKTATIGSIPSLAGSSSNSTSRELPTGAFGCGPSSMSPHTTLERAMEAEAAGASAAAPPPAGQSLRSRRVAMQREASRNALTMHQTRTALRSRSGASSAAGSTAHLRELEDGAAELLLRSHDPIEQQPEESTDTLHRAVHSSDVLAAARGTTLPAPLVTSPVPTPRRRLSTASAAESVAAERRISQGAPRLVASPESIDAPPLLPSTHPLPAPPASFLTFSSRTLNSSSTGIAAMPRSTSEKGYLSNFSRRIFGGAGRVTRRGSRFAEDTGGDAEGDGEPDSHSPEDQEGGLPASRLSVASSSSGEQKHVPSAPTKDTSFRRRMSSAKH